MWKGKYYEELRDAARAGEILSTLSDDLLSMQAPTLVRDQIEKFTLTEKTIVTLMNSRVVRQQLVYIVDKSNDSDLQELFSFINAIYHQNTPGSNADGLESFKSFLSTREKKYGKNSPRTYLARKCYIEELRENKKDKGFKLLRKNFEILLNNPELLPYAAMQDEAKYFIRYYDQTTESVKSAKAYKIFREFINVGRRTCPASSFTRAIEKV